MDKQQAVHTIHQMLDQDHSQDEIVRLLADQLRAPQDVVKKFVAQTATTYHDQKAKEVEDSKPTWLRELQSSANAPAQPSPLAAVPTPAIPAPTSVASIQLPPWLRENGPIGTVNRGPVQPASAWHDEQRAYVLQQLEKGRTYGDIADSLANRVGVVPLAARQFVREVDASRRAQTPRAVSVSANDQADHVSLQSADLSPDWGQPKPPRDPLKDPQLIEFVLDKLGSSRKRSDVVMAVCERANLSWEEAERVVAQAAIQQHHRGAARSSEAMMIIGLLAAIGGFALAAFYGLPMLVLWSKPISLGLRLPFNTEFASGQPALATTFFFGGLLFVGFGAAIAYLYYHAAEEQEA